MFRTILRKAGGSHPRNTVGKECASGMDVFLQPRAANARAASPWRRPTGASSRRPCCRHPPAPVPFRRWRLRKRDQCILGFPCRQIRAHSAPKAEPPADRAKNSANQGLPGTCLAPPRRTCGVPARFRSLRRHDVHDVSPGGIGTRHEIRRTRCETVRPSSATADCHQNTRRIREPRRPLNIDCA